MKVKVMEPVDRLVPEMELAAYSALAIEPAAHSALTMEPVNCSEQSMDLVASGRSPD
jgi:hypothetical protein